MHIFASFVTYELIMLRVKLTIDKWFAAACFDLGQGEKRKEITDFVMVKEIIINNEMARKTTPKTTSKGLKTRWTFPSQLLFVLLFLRSIRCCKRSSCSNRRNSFLSYRDKLRPLLLLVRSVFNLSASRSFFVTRRGFDS